MRSKEVINFQAKNLHRERSYRWPHIFEYIQTKGKRGRGRVGNQWKGDIEGEEEQEVKEEDRAGRQ